MEDARINHFTLYQHAKRPEWGLAVAISYLADRRIFLFENGERRAIMNEYGHLMSEVEPPAERASEVQRFLDKLETRAVAVAKQSLDVRSASTTGRGKKLRRAAAKARA